MAENSKVKLCYVITKREGRSFWSKIGAAFTNNDGSINVKLDALPVDGAFQICDYMPREEPEGDRGHRQSQGGQRGGRR